MRLRPEEQALLLALHRERSPEQDERLAALLSGERLDWARLWAEADEQQVVPTLAAALAAPPLVDWVPETAEERARAVRFNTTYCNLAVKSELDRIAAAMAAAGIPIAPLKGVHLAERAFDSLEARRVGDLDILVQPEQLEAARAVLLELGYEVNTELVAGRREHSFHGRPYVYARPPFTFVVELHWGLNQAELVSIDYPSLWRRILALSPSGPLRPLPTAETLVYLGLHLPKHDIGLLRLLLDLDRLVRREAASLSWEEVVALARSWGAEYLLWFSLDWAVRLFGTPVPTWVRRALRPAWPRRALLGWLAGPGALLRPPAHQHLRYNRASLAYCLLLRTPRRAWSAYRHHLLPDLDGGPSAPAARLGAWPRALAWTALAFASALPRPYREAADEPAPSGERGPELAGQLSVR